MKSLITKYVQTHKEGYTIEMEYNTDIIKKKGS